MTATAVPRTRLWLAVALALTVLKLWLTRGQGVQAMGGAGQDDLLLVRLAQQIATGEGLAPGHALALTPHPFYPLFITGAHGLGVPLFLAQQLFYATACALLVRALRPALAKAGAQLAFFALLLWNPMTFDGSSMSRVIPGQVQAPLVLMTLAGLAALNLRRGEPGRRQAPWGLLAGLAGGAFYLTGDGVAWFVPAGLLLAGAHLHGSWKISREAASAATRSLGLALLVALLPVLLIQTGNPPPSEQPAPGGGHATAIPPGRVAGTGPSWGQTVDFVVSFSRFSARAPASVGAPEELQLFRNVTRERLSPPVGEMDTVGGARYRLNLGKTELLQQVGKALRPLLLGLFILAQVVVLGRIGQAGWRRAWTFPLTLAMAAWGTGALAVFMRLQNPASSPYPVDTIAAFAAVYPLLLVFIGAVLTDAFSAWWPRRRA